MTDINIINLNKKGEVIRDLSKVVIPKELSETAVRIIWESRKEPRHAHKAVKSQRN